MKRRVHAFRLLTIVAILRTRHAVRLHYLSLVSAAVIGTAFAVALTSESYEDVEQGAQAEPAQPSPTTRAQVQVLATPARSVLVVFYLVADEEQRALAIDAVNSHLFARQAGAGRLERTVFLLAGTPEQESEVIDRLNFETMFAADKPVDIKVFDLRP